MRLKGEVQWGVWGESEGEVKQMCCKYITHMCVIIKCKNIISER